MTYFVTDAYCVKRGGFKFTGRVKEYSTEQEAISHINRNRIICAEENAKHNHSIQENETITEYGEKDIEILGEFASYFATIEEE